MYYKLAPHVRFSVFNSQAILGAASNCVAIAAEQHNDFLLLAKFLLEPRSTLDITNFLTKSTKLSPKDTVELLFTKKLIVRSSVDFGNKFNSRDWLFYQLYADPMEVYHELKDKHVVVVGAGGMGSHVAMMLAQAGIGKLTIIDDDEVSVSNLSRQFIYKNKDVEKVKVDCLGKSLNSLPVDTKIETLNLKIQDQQEIQQLGELDFIAVCCDDLQAHQQINKFCYNRDVPFMLAGYINEVATWGPLFVPSKTACYECFSKQWLADCDRQEHTEVNANFISPANAPLTMISASMMCLDVIKILGKFGKPQSLSRRVALWTEPLMLDRQSFDRLGSCMVCEKQDFNYLVQPGLN